MRNRSHCCKITRSERYENHGDRQPSLPRYPVRPESAGRRRCGSQFQDILSCHAALLTYLNIRETSKLYASIRGTQRLGVPCFQREDGSLTLELKDILG